MSSYLARLALRGVGLPSAEPPRPRALPEVLQTELLLPANVDEVAVGASGDRGAAAAQAPIPVLQTWVVEPGPPPAAMSSRHESPHSHRPRFDSPSSIAEPRAARRPLGAEKKVAERDNPVPAEPMPYSSAQTTPRAIGRTSRPDSRRPELLPLSEHVIAPRNSPAEPVEASVETNRDMLVRAGARPETHSPLAVAPAAPESESAPALTMAVQVPQVVPREKVRPVPLAGPAIRPQEPAPEGTRVDVEIGRIEVHVAAPMPAVSAPAPRRGFAEYRDVRNYRDRSRY